MAPSDLVGLAEAADWFPKRNGRKVSIQSIRRKLHTGVRGVRLQAIRDGGRWYTCRQWVEDFLAAVTAAHVPTFVTPAALAREVAEYREILRQKYGVRGSRPPRVPVIKTPERVKRLLAKKYGIHGAK